MSKDRRLIAGNWKMNTDLASAKELASRLANQISETSVPVVIGVPFPFLEALSHICKTNDRLHLAAQDCHQAENGAYTGEVSVGMLQSVGCEYVIVGHSERREYFAESDALIHAKVKSALTAGLTPIFCCGEKLNIREDGNYLDIIEQQLKIGLFACSAEEMSKLVVAYEPVWAIGTGRTASPEQAQEVHQHLRSVLAENYGSDLAEQITILYGGSVKPANAASLFSQKDVDGGLVGGASLQAEDFLKIIAAS